MVSRRVVALVCAVALVFGLFTLAGCAKKEEKPKETTEEKPAETAETAEPIKIGVQGPCSGSLAFEGQSIAKAVKLLAEQVNAAGGVLGRQIEIIETDDKGDPKEAALATQKLVNSGVMAAVVGYMSTATEPAFDILSEAGIVAITPGATATRLTEKGSKWTFRTCFLDDRQALAASDYILNKLGKKKLAIVHDNTTYAKGLADWTKKYFEEKGGQVVFFDAITPGERDFSPVLTSLKRAEPEVIYFTGYFSDGGLFIKQARELGIDIPFAAGDANNNPEFVKIAGVDYAKGAIITSAPMPHDLPYPEAKKFIADYEAKYGEPPTSIYGVFAADAFRVITEAIKQTNSTEPEKIADYLHNQLKDFPGFTGPINYDEKGDRTGSIHKAYVINEKGEFVPES